ncbi:hypothetical protein D3C81_1811360 [compost metagenome]
MKERIDIVRIATNARQEKTFHFAVLFFPAEKVDLTRQPDSFMTLNKGAVTLDDSKS